MTNCIYYDLGTRATPSENPGVFDEFHSNENWWIKHVLHSIVDVNLIFVYQEDVTNRF